jgi:hypothetical protein
MFKPQIDPYKDAYYYPFDGNTFIYTDINTTNFHKIHTAKFMDVTTYDDYAKYASIRGLLSGSTNSGNGFFPNTEKGFLIPDSKLLSPSVENFTEQGLNLLRKIIQLCKEKNVEVIMVVAPYQKKYMPSLYIKNYKEILDSVMGMQIKYGTRFFDYTYTPIAADTAYFYNSWHLNSTGANAYSLTVANDIKQCITNVIKK